MVTLTPITCVPASSVIEPAQYSRSASLGDTGIIELHLSNVPFQKVALCRIKMKRVSGTALDFTPRIFSKAGVTAAGDISQEYAGATTVIADLFDPATPQSAPVPMQTDELGNLYLLPGVLAGSTIVVDYCLRFYVHA